MIKTNIRATRITTNCDEPRIPMFRGKMPTEYVERFSSLNEAEDALDSSNYSLPNSAIEQISSICAPEEKSVKELVRCVGGWVAANISYNATRMSVSSKAARSLREKGAVYPMHRYLTSAEAWDAQAGICGEKSEIVVGLLRALNIPSSLYRPRESHFAAIAEDTENNEFYVYDATGGTMCKISGTPEKPATVVIKRWDPESTYTFGVTPYKDFFDWNLSRRQALGTTKACQLLAGVHSIDDNKRHGYFVNDEGELDESKLLTEGVDEKDVEKVKALFSMCKNYLDKVYETSEYDDVTADTDNILSKPPNKDLIEMYTGKEILDLELASECERLKHDTYLGTLIEKSLEDKCRKERTRFTRQRQYGTWPQRYRQTSFKYYVPVGGRWEQRGGCGIDLTEEDIEEDLEEKFFEKHGYVPDDIFEEVHDEEQEKETEEDIEKFRQWVLSKEKEHENK